MNLTIALDCDDTIINFIDTVVEVYNELYGTNFTVEEDITTWEIDKDKFEHGLFSVFEKSDNVIQRMKLKDEKIPSILKKYKDLGVKFYLVSSTQEENTFHLKEELFRQLGIHEYFDRFINTPCKHVVKADVLVDDYIENLNSYKKHHPFSYTLLFEVNHNLTTEEKEHTRIKDWEQLDKAFEFIVEYYNSLENKEEEK